jgi:aldehyde dehydrogenase (NAD+)/betaine-aldehyde dehydrogenase
VGDAHVSTTVKNRGWLDQASSLTIGGEAIAGEGEPLVVENPATGEEIVTLASATVAQVDAAVEAAAVAFKSWGRLPGTERAVMIERFADAIEARHDDFVDAIVSDAGSPFSMMGMQVGLPVAYFRDGARLAAIDRTESLGPTLVPGGAESVVAYRPMGVIGAVAAYNYPLTLSAFKLSAILAAGCTGVLIPSPQAPLAPLLLGQVAIEAGLPAGVINVIVGGVEPAARLTSHPKVAKVTFTGSVPIGRKVMVQAAEHLAGSVLELGGKSAAIVMPGTTLEPQILPLHQRYARNAGQGCQSPTRILVHEDQYDEFRRLSVEAYGKIPVGDPWDPDTVVGPLIGEAHRERVEGYVSGAVAEGATIIAGGGRPEGQDRGWFMNPVLVGDLDNSSRICQEELFGPVAAVVRYTDVDEAVEIANDTEFGLAAHVLADGTREAIALCDRLEAGSVYINGAGVGPVGVPLGGVKASGNGRENGEWGVREFLEPQHIQWALS